MSDAIGVEELKRAWGAVSAGQFRQAPPLDLASAPRPPMYGDGDGAWSAVAGERVLAVVGCAGSVGATTLAVALGLSHPGQVRVVECSSTTTSGLASASTAELGLHLSGWRQGRREHVVLERGGQLLTAVDDVPPPIPSDGAHDAGLTILDVGWDIGQLLGSSGWLATATRGADQLVLATTATVPGLRRAAVAIDLLSSRWQLDDLMLAVRGPRRKKWPRGVEHAGGHATRRVLDAGRYLEIPEDRDLAVYGVDSRPLPPPLIAAARRLFDHLAADLAPIT